MDHTSPPSVTPLANQRTVCWGVANDEHVIEIDVPDVGKLIERWPPIGLTLAEKPPAAVSRYLRLDTRAAAQPRSISLDDRLSVGWDRLESELALFAAERLTGLVAIHAAVVAVDGVIVLIPGESGVGKSTLCIAAAQTGAAVLSDEYALVDTTSGLVTGWNRPVRMRRAGGVDRFAIAVDSAPLPVGLVAVLRYDGNTTPSHSTITPGETAVSLMANTVCAQSRPDESLDAALAIAQVARAIAGTRGAAAPAFAELARLVRAAG